jgi:biopolymer transport protein ExbD
MKFPRNARPFRGQLDAAPFACVLFLLVIFVLLFTMPGSLLYTPGIPARIQQPTVEDLPGTDHPVVTVALDSGGRLYFENQLIGEKELKGRLAAAAKKTAEPLTLVIQADKSTAYESLLRLTMLAREAGINDALFAALPRALTSQSP